ncbi:lipopolysaccharide assembly protein LapA domain-containing protein [Sphingopyxis sp.]|uniref:lipopolysaccharide assembly protein LapA domain-containing protein n=1 Tax=Sphingopyxis sp. TaxID=1908224 RepID=UPI003D128266
MGILRTIIWVLLTAVLVAFAAMNWDSVDVTIWPTSSIPGKALIWSTKLPAVILISFAIGFFPPWLALRAARWSLKRRLESSERQLADMRALANRPVDPAPAATPVTDVPPAPTDLFSTDKP